ncbi:calcitonin gene-related peptide-like [Boleophthalmus pectinirostris]|uniref:calcitonin gene-related peptide-like n=1 Tax=Boleophthalmus pectinirostris TaxID=150288 RepID=UPI0024303B7C|nr:calcitonin gene-related peptide-like [Boleophthalmus pectinirostris]
MLVVKISAVLITYALLLCHAHRSQAAPTSSRSSLDSVSLSDLEVRRLLNAILREFVQMSAEEEQDTTSTLQKRACNTATCVTHRLADFLSRSGGMGNAHFVPTNVGAKAFGRRRRTVH